MKQGGVHQRRTRFIKEYLLDQNATRAAIAAGFSEKTAHVQGHRLLNIAKIAAAIEEGNAKVNERLDLTAERLKKELARLCYLDPRKFFNEDGTLKPVTQLDEDSARGLAGFEAAELFEGSGEERAAVAAIKKFKFCDKNRAIETAARCLKMLTDRVEVAGMDALAEELAKARQRSEA